MMRQGMGVTVEIFHRRMPSKTISMSMGEYKEFIKEEAVNLGLITEEAREIKGFTLIGEHKMPKGLMDMIMSTKPKEEHTCPRCENEEIEDSHNFCMICGLPVERREKVNDGE